MKKRLFFLLAAVSVASMAGCVKDDRKYASCGKIILTADWNRIITKFTVPESYNALLGGTVHRLSGETNEIPYLLSKGKHPLLVYNTADGINIVGNMAYVDKTSQGGNTIVPLPGHLYSYATDIQTGDLVIPVTAYMGQQQRELTLILVPAPELEDKILEITATMSGVAGSLDMYTGTLGDVSEVPLSFAKNAEGMWQVTVRLLGIVGDNQKISGILTIMDVAVKELEFSSGLSIALGDFNASKTPLVLRTEISVQSSYEGEPTTLINPWTEVGGTGEAS